MRRAALLVLLLLGTSAQAERPRAALVTTLAPGPPPAALEALRATLAQRYEIVGDPDIVRVLERFEAPPDPRARVRAALDRAHDRMRKLDIVSARAALDEAWTAALALPPTPESFSLVATVASRSAALALVGNDMPAARREAAMALSAFPGFTLDPAEAPPPLVKLFSDVRRERSTSPRVTATITADVDQARVVYEAAARGQTPIELAVRSPSIVWLAADGRESRTLVIEGAGPVRVELSPISRARRIAPLVEALRAASGDRGREAAALGEALGVDRILLIGAEATVLRAIDVHELSARTPDRPKRPWYKKGWVWGTAAGGLLVVGGAIALGVLLGGSNDATSSHVLTCCR